MNNKPNKALVKLVIIIAIIFTSFASYSTHIKAAPLMKAEVLSSWKVITNKKVRVTTDRNYITIRFKNGASYTETKKNVTTFVERMLGNSVYQYNRSYRVY